jgi:hypothetical protein
MLATLSTLYQHFAYTITHCLHTYTGLGAQPLEVYTLTSLEHSANFITAAAAAAAGTTVLTAVTAAAIYRRLTGSQSCSCTR